MKEQCLIIAGEKSGEEHCLSFFDSIKANRPDCHFFGVGGNELAAKDMELLYHLKDFSSWGFSEVIGKIPFYIKAFNHIVDEVKKRNCKVAILIDFQDFNLRLAKKLQKEGVKVLYYVAPQAWAWKAYRAKVLEETVHTLFTIIPFEKKWFGDRGVQRVRSVAHPLWITYKDELESFKRDRSYSEISKEKRLLLLPGSRNFEVKNLLPDFVETVKTLRAKSNLKVGIVCSSNVDKNLYAPYLDSIDVIFDNEQLSEALKWGDCSIAASGTVTLATALFGLPTVVCYKSSFFNEFIYYTFITYDGPISLANIFRNKRIFPELVQEGCSPYTIAKAFDSLMGSKESYENIVDELKVVFDEVQGEHFDVGQYMSEVIKESYEN
ncbi:lipid-A-disaccharide synthase [Halobacteriovorax sp. GB3]|uniref:lipid-A-disaccharide synthase n=1 Tax=Halobacteriovorax sp. GB3 TaxID=2719615 RepID=UPI00235E6C34|nr:lipid-A-disaccharide synthase [Halobacteriovorax sp. GB3]MDD0854093.1 lipid-A-disaccharide synthase [Halobacteriovorax sp. GB3]